MTSIITLGAVTVGIDLPSSRAEIRSLGLVPGTESIIPIERMEAIRLALEKSRGTLPKLTNGGSIGNTANLIARAGIRCGFMGVGGNDPFGRIFAANCERASLAFLSRLEDGAVTGYDFYLYDEGGERTIILAHGANTLLSPERIDFEAIQNSELLLLDCLALSFGLDSEAAVRACIQAAQASDVPFVLALAGTDIVDSCRGFFESFAPKSQMVAGNLAQAAVLVGLEPDASLDEVKIELAKTSIDAVVTLDAEGAFARIGGGEFFMPAQKIQPVDPTGAGDNFLGAFLVAQRRGLSVHQSLAVGNIIAGEIVQHHGAQLPPGVDVMGLMQAAIHSAAILND